ncbi:MAG: glycosyltransferase family A protein [Dongiaceae bacterium]
MIVGNPLVSVVVPAFNAAQTIQETLESISKQTYANLEVIVVDDGSTDDTVAIARQHGGGDLRFRVVVQRNQGVAAARNAGIRASKADFVAFVDADDLWHPTKIAKQLDVLLSSDADTALVYSPFRLIDAEGHVLASPHRYGVSGWVVHRHFFTNLVGNGSALLVRRSVLEEFGGFDPWLRRESAEGCEDLLLQLRIAARYRFAEVSEYLVGYRRLPTNMSSNTEQMVRSGILAVNKALSECGSVPGLSARAMLKRYEWQRLKLAVRRGQPVASLRGLVQLASTSPFFVLGAFYQDSQSLAGKLLQHSTAAISQLFRQRPPACTPRHFYDYDPKWGINPFHSTSTSRALRRLARFDRGYRPITRPDATQHRATAVEVPDQKAQAFEPGRLDGSCTYQKGYR